MGCAVLLWGYCSKCLNSSSSAVGTPMHVTKFRSVFQLRSLRLSISAFTTAILYPRTSLETQDLHAEMRHCKRLVILSQISTNAQNIPMIMSWQMCCFGDQHVAA